MTYQTDLGSDAFGNITRINNVLHDLPKRLAGTKAQLESIYDQQAAAKAELEKPFALSDELAEKEARLALLNAELNIDGREDAEGEMQVGEDDTRDADIRNDAEPEAKKSENYDKQLILDTIRSHKAVPPIPGRAAADLAI